MHGGVGGSVGGFKGRRVELGSGLDGERRTAFPPPPKGTVYMTLRMAQRGKYAEWGEGMLWWGRFLQRL